jgi:hypothetical protein
MIEKFPMGSLEWQLDPGLRVAFSRWEGEFSGDDLLAALQRTWHRHPELAGYGAVHDQLDFTGTIEHNHYPRIMQAWASFCGDPHAKNRTAIVNGSAMKFLEIKLLGLGGNAATELGLFPDNASALAWVIADAPGNPSAGGRPSRPLPRWFHRRVRPPQAVG